MNGMIAWFARNSVAANLLMVFINRKRELHVDLATAIREANAGRFRPMLLTSLTTFFGFVPLMLDQSFGTAFIVPMAVSLAFGVLFATFITLVLVPMAYLILDDAQRVFRSLLRVPPSGTGATPIPS